MFVALDKNGGIPIRKQLYDAVTAKILKGELAKGDKLPSTRELADKLGIARNTVIEIYEQLVSEAYLETFYGRGTFVAKGNDSITVSDIPTESMAAVRIKPVNDNDCINFMSGVPDLDSFPRKAWLRALKESLEDADDTWLGYGSVFGYRPLRESLARHLMRNKGIHCSYRQIVIVNGTSDALALLALLFQKPSRRIMVESAVVSFVPDIFQTFGYTLIPLKTDQSGLCTGDLPEGEGGLIFTSPSHQFPLGGTMCIERRCQLADYAKTRRHYIIEDDYDSEFRYSGAPVNSIYQLAPENVIHLGTFSKTLAPFLRMGYMVLPEELVPQMKNLKTLLNHRVNTHEQMALNLLFEQGVYVKHVTAMCKHYKKKMQCITNSLNDEFGDYAKVWGGNSGLHVAVVFPGLSFDAQSPEILSRHKVCAELLTDYLVEKQENCDTLILGFGHLSEKAIAEGIRRLKAAVMEIKAGKAVG